MAIFHNKTTYLTKPNKVSARLLSFALFVEPPGSGDGTVIFQFIGNPTLSGTPSYTDIDATNSVIEYDHTIGTGASVTYVSGGRVALTEYVGYAGAAKGGAANLVVTDPEKLNLIIRPGGTFAILAKDTGGNGVVVRIAFNWEELF